MDAGADVNTLLLSWLCCVERIVVERPEFGGQETYTVGESYRPRSTGNLGMFLRAAFWRHQNGKKISSNYPSYLYVPVLALVLKIHSLTRMARFLQILCEKRKFQLGRFFLSRQVLDIPRWVWASIMVARRGVWVKLTVLKKSATCQRFTVL